MASSSLLPRLSHSSSSTSTSATAPITPAYNLTGSERPSPPSPTISPCRTVSAVCTKCTTIAKVQLDSFDATSDLTTCYCLMPLPHQKSSSGLRHDDPLMADFDFEDVFNDGHNARHQPQKHSQRALPPVSYTVRPQQTNRDWSMLSNFYLASKPKLPMTKPASAKHLVRARSGGIGQRLH